MPDLAAVSTLGLSPDAAARLLLAHIKTRLTSNAGRPTLTVPLVAMVGNSIVHAVNSPCPEFVPLSVIADLPSRWNGKPVLVNHPTKNGVQISALENPEVLNTTQIGTIANARIDGAKLRMDAVIDIVKAWNLDPDLLTVLSSGQKVEVSIGAFVVTQDKAGISNGSRYDAVWNSLEPDHLAILPSTRGACSISDGCGVRAAVAHLQHVSQGGSMSQDLEELSSRNAPPDPYAAGLAKRRAAAAPSREELIARNAEIRNAQTSDLDPTYNPYGVPADPYKIALAVRQALREESNAR